MLLKVLHDLADRENLLRDLHVEQRPVHLLIPISTSGEFIGEGVISLHSQDRKGKTVLGRKLTFPRFPGENNGGRAYFLAESCTHILGIETPSGTGLSLNLKKKPNAVKSFLHFWEQIEAAEREIASPVLKAVLRFRESYLHETEGCLVHKLPFIELKEGKPKGKRVPELRVCARTSGGEWIPLANLTLSFQVDGNLIFSPDPDDSLHRYWREQYRKIAFSEANSIERAGGRGLCMITEVRDAPIARSHKPKILRVPNLSSGGYLVSFAREAPAFSSFGFEMGENAPISETAAASYALGLQRLLDSENNSLRTGPSAVCFWVRSRPEKTRMFASMLNQADPKAVADFLRNPWQGINRGLAKQEDFYSVTLSGNAGRVVVRHWMQLTLERAVENFADWFKDLEIVRFRANEEGEGTGKISGSAYPDTDKRARVHPLALFRLACATVREAKDLRTHVVGQLYRAALEGSAPSVSLAKLILDELRSALVGDSPKKQRYPFSPSRFALLKLILNRNRKGDEPMIQPQIFETDDEAYNCGRLLAVLAEAQERAHEFKLEGPGIAERYFGTASVSPSSVLPLLIRLNRHHLEKIRKSNQYSHHARFIEKEIQSIMAHFTSRTAGQPPAFPRYLDLKKQGRFAIGFYQQKAKAEAERNAALDEKKQDKPVSPEEVS